MDDHCRLLSIVYCLLSIIYYLPCTSGCYSQWYTFGPCCVTPIGIKRLVIGRQKVVCSFCPARQLTALTALR